MGRFIGFMEANGIMGKSAGVASAPEAVSEMAVPWDTESSLVFAYWKKDDAYYPANVAGRIGNTVNLNFLDGTKKQLDVSEIISAESMKTANMLCNREKKGLYYPCTLTFSDDESFEAVYHDGFTEPVTIEQLRLHLR